MESAVKPSPRLIPIGNIESDCDGLLSESKVNQLLLESSSRGSKTPLWIIGM